MRTKKKGKRNDVCVCVYSFNCFNLMLYEIYKQRKEKLSNKQRFMNKPIK
jgi:hypothetical protein